MPRLTYVVPLRCIAAQQPLRGSPGLRWTLSRPPRRRGAPRALMTFVLIAQYWPGSPELPLPVVHATLFDARTCCASRTGDVRFGVSGRVDAEALSCKLGSDRTRPDRKICCKMSVLVQKRQSLWFSPYNFVFCCIFCCAWQVRKLWADHVEGRSDESRDTGVAGEAAIVGVVGPSSLSLLAPGQGARRALRAFVDAVDLSDAKQAVVLQNLVRWWADTVNTGR